MALPGYLAMGAGYDTGDVALTLYGKGGYDFYLILSMMAAEAWPIETVRVQFG